MAGPGDDSRFAHVEHSPDGFDALAVNAEIAVAEPRRRTDPDALRLAVEHELDIVNEPQQFADDLDVEVIGLPRNQLRAFHARDNGVQYVHRLVGIACEREWRNSVAWVRLLAVHAIRLVGTRCKFAVVQTQVPWSGTGEHPAKHHADHQHRSKKRQPHEG